MLPLLRERLCIALSPDHIAWVILARGWSKRIRAQGIITVPLATDGFPWKNSVEILKQELANIPIKRGMVSVVLSNALVRYLVINSSTVLSKAEERLALARHDFRKIHGTLADTWEIRISSGEQNYLAVALDGELLAQLRQCFVHAGHKLHSIQPYAVTAFNHCAKHFNGKTAEGLFLAETHGYCYVGMNSGKWEFFRCGRWEGEPLETCQHVLQREARYSGIDSRQVWMAPAHDIAVTKEMAQQYGLKMLPLSGGLPAAKQTEYLIAMLGAG